MVPEGPLLSEIRPLPRPPLGGTTRSLLAPVSVQPGELHFNRGNSSSLFLLSRGALSSHGSLRTWVNMQRTEIKQIESVFWSCKIYWNVSRSTPMSRFPPSLYRPKTFSLPLQHFNFLFSSPQPSVLCDMEKGQYQVIGE